MQSPENPEEEKTATPIDSRPIDYGILLGLAAILAGLAIWMGKTGNGTGAGFSGVGAVSAFCLAQIRAGRPLHAGIAASFAGAGVSAFLTFFNALPA